MPATGHEQPVVAFSQFAPEQSLSLMGALDRSGMIHVSKLMDSQALNIARISRQSASRQAEATAERPGDLEHTAPIWRNLWFTWALRK